MNLTARTEPDLCRPLSFIGWDKGDHVILILPSTHTNLKRQTSISKEDVVRDLLNTPLPPHSFPLKCNSCQPWTQRRRKTNPLARSKDKRELLLFICKQGGWLITLLLVAFFYLSHSFIVLTESGTRRERWHQCWTPCRHTLVLSVTLQVRSLSFIRLIFYLYCPENSHHQTLSTVTVVRLMKVLKHITSATLTDNDNQDLGSCVKLTLSMKSVNFQCARCRHSFRALEY